MGNSPNLYQFGFNNPFNYSDPMGLVGMNERHDDQVLKALREKALCGADCDVMTHVRQGLDYLGDVAIDRGDMAGAVTAYYLEAMAPANDAWATLEAASVVPLGLAVKGGMRLLGRAVSRLAEGGSRIGRALTTELNPFRWFDDIADDAFGGLSELDDLGLRPDFDIWKLDPKIRGRRIESEVAEEYAAAGWQKTDDFINPRTGEPFRSDNFPLIDFQMGDHVVSLKSVDTTGATWMGRMEKHIRDLANRRVTIDGRPAASVSLDLRVEPGGTNAASPLIEFGDRIGVPVSIREFP